MTVRAATLEDLDEVAVLFDAYRLFYRKSSDLPGAKKFLSERMSNNQSVIYLMEENHQLVGFVQLYPLFSSTRMKRLWLLNDLFVHPDFRGKGISKSLIRKCFELMKETNACGVLLETEKSNVIGNKLYQQLGFHLEENNFYFYENSESSKS